MSERSSPLVTSIGVLPAQIALPRSGEAELRLEDVYAAHAQTVLDWAARLGGPWVDPEDITHDVFVTVSRRLASWRPDAPITTWLFALTRHAVQNRRRREKARAVWRALWGEASPEPVAPASDDLERAEDKRRVRAALDRISGRYREVLVLFELEGRSGREVAQLLGMREPALWVLLHRARAALAAQLEETEKNR